jgi:hypothetical protein
VTRLEGNIDNLETRLARLMGEYSANMTTLGQRLQIVEKLSETRQVNVNDDKLIGKNNTVDATGIGTREDDV